MSTSYYPETDGSSEQSNKTMIESLRHYVNLQHTNWAEHLIYVEAAMSNSVNATTGLSPNEVVYGSPLRLFPSPRDLAKPLQDVPSVTDYIRRIQDNIALARDRHAKAKMKQTTYANWKRRPEPEYKVGDKVYLETKDLRLRIKQSGRSAKFYPHYVGPFEIIKSQPKTSNYTLKLPRSIRSTLRYMRAASSRPMRMILLSFLVVFPLNHPQSMLKITNTSLRPSSITERFVGSANSWFIGKDMPISRIHGSRKRHRSRDGKGLLGRSGKRNGQGEDQQG